MVESWTLENGVSSEESGTFPTYSFEFNEWQKSGGGQRHLRQSLGNATTHRNWGSTAEDSRDQKEDRNKPDSPTIEKQEGKGWRTTPRGWAGRRSGGKWTRENRQHHSRCRYIRPQATTEEVIETLMTAITDTGRDESVIMVGDLNCRIDKNGSILKQVPPKTRKQWIGGKEITEDEITQRGREAKKRKATGPGQIAYEHLNASADIFKIVWIELFNKCMKMDPCEQWRRATLKILYKGKGSTEDMNSYRGWNILKRKLKDMIGNDHPIAGIVEDIMRRNWLEISDEVAASDEKGSIACQKIKGKDRGEKRDSRPGEQAGNGEIMVFERGKKLPERDGGATDQVSGKKKVVRGEKGKNGEEGEKKSMVGKCYPETHHSPRKSTTGAGNRVFP
ncbi:hypothetical protein ANN_17886 [Periplaneta americana]|uniref:Endonuclease/exonuclease/phosphatase domain-containing protein n=1 Tax=Periplaneta americana TaxID=6978 RepID=A0ABQ8SU73_PERAM|nr:hypothetical protein ANN_17886 [Periplaneta americana]